MINNIAQFEQKLFFKYHIFQEQRNAKNLKLKSITKQVKLLNVVFKYCSSMSFLTSIIAKDH